MNCTCELSECLSPGAKDPTIFKANISLLNTLLKHFTPCFSKKQWLCLFSPFYALFKKLSGCNGSGNSYRLSEVPIPIFMRTSISSQTLPGIYQPLNERGWKSFKNKELLPPPKMDFLPSMTQGRPKPFAKKTQGAKWQYCGPLKREEVCNVGVCVAFVSKTKHFPIDIGPYLPADEFPGGKSNPHFKDKLHIARQELFDKLPKNH